MPTIDFPGNPRAVQVWGVDAPASVDDMKRAMRALWEDANTPPPALFRDGVWNLRDDIDPTAPIDRRPSPYWRNHHADLQREDNLRAWQQRNLNRDDRPPIGIETIGQRIIQRKDADRVQLARIITERAKDRARAYFRGVRKLAREDRIGV